STSFCGSDGGDGGAGFSSDGDAVFSCSGLSWEACGEASLGGGATRGAFVSFSGSPLWVLLSLPETGASCATSTSSSCTFSGGGFSFTTGGVMRSGGGGRDFARGSVFCSGGISATISTGISSAWVDSREIEKSPKKRSAKIAAWTRKHAARIRANGVGAWRSSGAARRSAGYALRLTSGVSGPDVTFHHTQYVLPLSSMSRPWPFLIRAGLKPGNEPSQARIDGLLARAEKCCLCRGGFNHRENILDLFGNKIAHFERNLNKAPLAHMGEKLQQGLPEPPDVGDHDWFRVTLELDPGQLFGEFLQGPDAARQRDECVGALEHQTLALMHVADDKAFLDFGQEVLFIHQKF